RLLGAPTPYPHRLTGLRYPHNLRPSLLSSMCAPNPTPPRPALHPHTRPPSPPPHHVPVSWHIPRSNWLQRRRGERLEKENETVRTRYAPRHPTRPSRVPPMRTGAPSRPMSPHHVHPSLPSSTRVPIPPHLSNTRSAHPMIPNQRCAPPSSPSPPPTPPKPPPTPPQ